MYVCMYILHIYIYIYIYLYCHDEALHVFSMVLSFTLAGLILQFH